MITVKLYNSDGTIKGEISLDPKLFGVEVRAGLVHEVMTSLSANARQSLAHTKTKGEVSGGGKKPWKQKGTGRARQGSTRSPQWVGGGVAFGPRKERDYSVKINKKMKRLVMAMALSDKVAGDRLLVLESYPAKTGKTKEMSTVLKTLPVKGSTLCMQAVGDPMLARSVRNLPKIHFANTTDISIADVLHADFILVTPAVIEKLTQMYGNA